MSDNPISNPGVSPSQPVRGPANPLGPDIEEQGPGSFTLAPEGSQVKQPPPPTQYPSPMEVAGDAARQQHPDLIPPEELSEHVGQLQNQLGSIREQLQSSSVTQNLTSDHYTAMQKVVQAMNPDMQNIAKYTQGTFNPPGQQPNQSVLNYVTNWIDASQGTMGSALNYLQTSHDAPDPVSALRLQYAVQRASQRGALFATIVGSTVSGIKTILSTQLG